MNSIQKKILMFTTIVVVVMSVIWLALSYYNHKTQIQYTEILNRYLILNEVTTASQHVITELNYYMFHPSPENLERLKQRRLEIDKAKYEVAKVRNKENDFTLTNYTNLIDSLIETTDRVILFQLDKDTEAAFKEFEEANLISNYISEMTLTLFGTELKTSEPFYRGIMKQSEELIKLGILLMFFIICLLLFITYWFSLNITRPIHMLTKAASELSKGRFDQEINVETNDEIAFLAKTFDHMRININKLIKEMTEKAKLEHELQQNKLLLQESQLQSLQSQINPHFLFNTLNTLSKKAYLEGSEETSDLLVSVSDLLRYNLKQIDRSVTLHDEVNVLKQYMAIQKSRFTERLQLHLVIDEACLHVQIPALTLQPIIENAVIHAVEPREEGGVISFRVIDGTDKVIVEIEDDGLGMTEEKTEQILKEQYVQAESHSTGIGFSNVVKRLRLFYQDEDVIQIQSELGRGTKVMLIIPKKGDVKHYEAPNCG